MFLREFAYAHQGCMYLIENTVNNIINICEVLLQLKITVF